MSIETAPTTEQVPNNTPPIDLSSAVEALMDRMSNLSAVYQEETEALRRADTKSFAEIQIQKTEAAHHYEQDIQALLLRKDAISALDPSLKEKLKELQDEFSTLVQENARALSRMQDTTKRLNGMIMTASRKAVHSELAVNYGESGKLIAEGRKQISMGRVSKNA